MQLSDSCDLVSSHLQPEPQLTCVTPTTSAVKNELMNIFSVQWTQTFTWEWKVLLNSFVEAFNRCSWITIMSIITLGCFRHNLSENISSLRTFQNALSLITPPFTPNVTTEKLFSLTSPCWRALVLNKRWWNKSGHLFDSNLPWRPWKSPP